jgi:hypothetical protein
MQCNLTAEMKKKGFDMNTASTDELVNPDHGRIFMKASDVVIGVAE